MSRSEELELQYSPSRWSKRYPAEEVVQKHLEFITKASFEARKSIPCQLDVPYGPTKYEKMDIFGTDLSADSPIFIFVHGGYWQELNRELSSYVAKALTKCGFKVIILGYTLCPHITLMEIMGQIERAFLQCLEYAKNNGSRRLYICGHSAGAHLTASLFQTHLNLASIEKLNLAIKVFLISGVYDLLPLTETYINDALKLDNVTAKKLSPQYQHFKMHKNVKFFIIIGENDSPAFIEQSQALDKKLKNGGNESELITVIKTDHFDIVERLNEDNYELITMIVNMEKCENVCLQQILAK